MSFSPAATYSVPRRQELLDSLASWNRWVPLWLILQIAISVAAAYWTDWKSVFDRPIVSVVAVGFVLGPYVMAVLRSLAQKKKEIGDLRESTRFGVFDKHKLQKIYKETLTRLGLPDERVPLYITADKTVNALASHFGLGPLFKRINGIYLYRQVLHLLTPEEVQDTIGHELGHYYKYYFRLDRYRWVSLIMSTLLALLAIHWFGANNFLVYAVLALCSWSAYFLTGMSFSRNAHTIEYLCDDLGAHTNGVATSINSLMKLGHSSELHATIFFESMLAKRFQNLDASAIFESIERAMPYGKASQEEIKKAVEVELKRKQESGPSVGGFLHYLWNAEGEAAANEELQKSAENYARLKQSPRLNWESLLADPNNIAFAGESLVRLIDMIESNPGVPLFHDYMGDESESTHPRTELRILYLWYNKHEIESTMRR
jgi:Zn-dependent protease with chaperone function